MTATVQQGQSIIDLAIQHLGGIEASFALAELNGISITEILTPGQVLQLPAAANKDIAKYYADRAIVPATGTNIDLENNRTFDGTFGITFY
jgi:hypothetical protein